MDGNHPKLLQQSSLRGAVLVLTVFVLLGLMLTIAATGCRSDSSPEEVTQSMASFAGEVVYNSAGSSTAQESGVVHPRNCPNCNGLGYYQETTDPSGKRINCPACQGRGWQ